MSTQILSQMSNKYGANPDFVLAGGGNTSYKTADTLYIKGSGTVLATIKPEEFVVMSRAGLAKMWSTDYPEDEQAREAAVLADMMASRVEGETRRPSVETSLHDLFKQSYVLHLHPANVNGITCAVDGEKTIREMFPTAVWIEAVKPGFILAGRCKTEMDAYESANSRPCDLMFLQNHGVFFAADDMASLDALVEQTMDKINTAIKRQPDFEPADTVDTSYVKIAPAIRTLYAKATGKSAIVKFDASREILAYCANREAFEPLVNSYTPDHIVYCKANPLYAPFDGDVDTLRADLQVLHDAYVRKYTYAPKIVFVQGVGMFSSGNTKMEADTSGMVFKDAIKIAVYTESFGGYLSLRKDLEEFIINWEVESYRSKAILSGEVPKRLAEKVAVITGSAQGFGMGIAEEMASEGAYVVIADINSDGANSVANRLNMQYGKIVACAVSVDVTSEDAIKAMMASCVAAFGGIDIFVNNAGIAKAGSLEQMEKRTFELVTAINYTAYFLCVKYASEIMKVQRAFDPDWIGDIIEINSKSGLTGSNKNFAYAGSKFGGIGLTQSFAMELVEYGIKVNAICPGNFLDGPLWSDPENGLFVQYLRAGKVPGAKTIADVRRSYESKVPMNRGCTIRDVAAALFYLVEQKYETGQALPVTGGQEMLK